MQEHKVMEPKYEQVYSELMLKLQELKNALHFQQAVGAPIEHTHYSATNSTIGAVANGTRRQLEESVVKPFVCHNNPATGDMTFCRQERNK